MDEKVKAYIDNQKSPQKEILKKVRGIFLKAIPKFEEKSAWGVIALMGGKFYLAAMKECVHIGFSINGLNEKEISQFEGSGKTMRHIKVRSLKDIDKKKIVDLIGLVNKKAKCVPC